MCSAWSGDLTKRSFLCAVIVSGCFKLVENHSRLHSGNFILGHLDYSELHVENADVFWFTLLALMGGALGSLYTHLVAKCCHLRKIYVTTECVRRGRTLASASSSLAHQRRRTSLISEVEPRRPVRSNQPRAARGTTQYPSLTRLARAQPEPHV